MQTSVKTVKRIISIALLILFSLLGMPAFNSVKADNTASIRYITCVKGKGWDSKYVTNGKISGSPTEPHNLQAMKIKVMNDEDLGLSYSCNVNTTGWQNSVTTNKISGLVKNSAYIETIKVNLTGKDADKYDIYYKVNVKGLGWLDWAINGQEAGTVGMQKPLKAIRVMLVSKGAPAPGSIAVPCKYSEPKVSFRTYNKTFDWSNWINSSDPYDDEVNDSYKIQGIQLNSFTGQYKGGISYKVLVNNKGWQDIVSDGNTAGDIDGNSNIEAVQMFLTGEISNKYDIYYRVYANNIGWLDWAKDGEPCGTSGYSYDLQSMQVKLINKGENPSINTSNHYMISDSNTDNESNFEYLQWNQDKNELYIYRKASEKDSWIRQVFSHLACNSIKKSNRIKLGNQLASCYDIWSLKGAYICSKNEDGTFTDTYNYPIIHDDAEWEMAIKEVVDGTATPDFVGGICHGNEIVNNISFEVDGKLYTKDDLASLNGVKCKKLEIKRNSKVYRDNTLETKKTFDPAINKPSAGTQIATHYVDYVVTPKDITINQDLNWLVDTECEYSCMAMLGVKRVSGDGKLQITDTAKRQGDINIYDCSAPGVKTGIFKSKPDCKSVSIWNSGKNGGLKCSFTAEILSETEMPGKNFKVSNHTLYNKLYFGYCAAGQKVTKGDDWNCSARYIMDYNGMF